MPNFLSTTIAGFAMAAAALSIVALAVIMIIYRRLQAQNRRLATAIDK
jgi:NADH:ubiquinone oxidoreductase subunit K